jgi:hypothetical protein
VVSAALFDGPRAGDRWHRRCGAGGPSPPPPTRSSFPWLAPSALVVPLAP